MGAHVIRCYLGFSTNYANEFSERLERRAAELSRLFCKSHTKFLQGLESIHDAVDAALCDAKSQSASCLSSGLAELTECRNNLALMAGLLSSTHVDLIERVAIDPGDPLIYRERFFAVIDYDESYRTLATRGSALPRQVFWDEVVLELKSGGACAGVRLLERQLGEIHADLDSYIQAVEEMKELPIREFGHSLHGTSLEVSRLVVGFTRFLTICTYIAILCETAMVFHEQERTELSAAIRALAPSSAPATDG